MILPPNDSTLVARNGHFRITSLVAEEFPWHRLGPADVRRQTQAMRSTWPQCRQHVLRRAFRVPHFEQVRYMARAKAWVKAALTPRMTISKAIWRNVSRMRARLRVNSSTASDGRGRMNEEEWGHPPGGPIKRGDKYLPIGRRRCIRAWLQRLRKKCCGALPLGGAHLAAFCQVCDCQRSHTSQKPRCMRHP